MAICVTRPRTRWWANFSGHVHRAPDSLAEIVEQAGRTRARFPGVRMRVVNGHPEPYVVTSGLAVWEVAWLARAHHGDAEAIARHTAADRELIEEALAYASEHATEIDAQIASHTERSLEELLELLPGMRVITFDAGGPNGHDI